MKRVYNNYFLVGLFSLVIGGITILLLLNMSGKNNDADIYYSYFDNVTGLGYGNPVYYEGYRVGQVEKITPEPVDGKLIFKTEYTLLSGWNVPIDSYTQIASSGLLSDMSLSIHAGTSKETLAINSEIRGVKGADIMASVSKLANDFGKLNEEKISPLIDLVYERTDTLTKSLETQIPEVLTSIEILIKDINKLVVTAQKLVDEDNIEGINKILSNVEQMTSQLSSAGNWVEGSMNKVNGLLQTGEELISNSDTKVSTLLNLTIQMLETFSTKAETISNELESASMNINETTETIRKKPSSLLFKPKSKIADDNL